MKNISETGALIIFQDGSFVPNAFTLINKFDGYRVECEIVRRIGNSAGVRFTGAFQRIEATRKQVVQPVDFKPISYDCAVASTVETSIKQQEEQKQFKKKIRPSFGKRGQRSE